MIYETLVRETKARGARKIRIINLGLEPWEAVELGLEVENADEDDKRKPVAAYVHEYDREHGTNYAEWLQTHRVELNAMTTRQFIAWLDRKMAEHGDGKLIPPDEAVVAEMETRLDEKVRAVIRDRILREAGYEDQVAEALATIERPSARQLNDGIKESFALALENEWRKHIEEVAGELTKGAEE